MGRMTRQVRNEKLNSLNFKNLKAGRVMATRKINDLINACNSLAYEEKYSYLKIFINDLKDIRDSLE